MPRRPKAEKLREDVAETAIRDFQEAVGERPKTPPPEDRTDKNPQAVERGRKGGEKGGRSRDARLTEEERQVSARRAAKTWWEKRD
jgi:hypothetical protein